MRNKNLHIENSYKIWTPRQMKKKIRQHSLRNYGLLDAEGLLNRDFLSMYVEWWLHNIGYYLTLPLLRFGIEWIRDVHRRCRDVDLEEWMEWL